MRGTRARELKKVMPKDLREKMKEEVYPFARKRQEEIKASRAMMEKQQGVAFQEHQKRAREADQKYGEEVIKITEKYEKLAKERHGTVERETAPA